MTIHPFPVKKLGTQEIDQLIDEKDRLLHQINRKIKEVFGKPVDEIKNDYDLDTLMVIRIKIDRVIQTSEAVPLNRSRIKKLIYQAIEDVFKLMN